MGSDERRNVSPLICGKQSAIRRFVHFSEVFGKFMNSGQARSLAGVQGFNFALLDPTFPFDRPA
jgi:hypothetical protein